MCKPPLTSSQNINHLNKSQSAQESKSSLYVESVRITPERLIKILEDTYRKGGVKGVRDE